MKIEHIKAALEEISAEDEATLNHIKQELQNCDAKIKELLLNLDEAREHQQKLLKINELRNDKGKKAKLLRGLFQKVGGVFLICAGICAPGSFVLSGIAILLGLLILCNGVHIYNQTIGSVMQGNIVSNYIRLLHEVFQDKSLIYLELMAANELNNSIAHEISQNEQNRNSLVNEADSIKDELSNIEGYQLGLTTLNDKYKIPEVSDNLEVVGYVESRKKRRLYHV